MLSVENISKKFGDQVAVNAVSFAARQGETIAILGTSGCGKSTTLRMINRLLEPDSGQIIINNKNAADYAPETLRRHIGYVLQFNGLFPHYTVAENIGMVPALLQWTSQKIQARVLELLKQLRLPAEYATRYPSALSGGENQRVGIARALAADPPLLLMDEPFGALDNITRSGITKDFMQLDALKNKTVVMVTHDVREAFTMADKIILMHAGEVMQQGTAKELLFKPANNFVKEFFDADRLQLELDAITLGDLMPYFSEQPGNAKTLATDISVAAMLQHRNGMLYGSRQTGLPPTLGNTEIFAAFEKFKNSFA